MVRARALPTPFRLTFVVRPHARLTLAKDRPLGLGDQGDGRVYSRSLMTFLPAGLRLGPYELLAKLGEGGPPPLARVTARASYGVVPPKPSGTIS
ncbi:MAG: hypothetical protein H0X67_10975 [Acidobacteria bacterium]|nr:hypothetical protein [Acidobacteriota bacterium]